MKLLKARVADRINRYLAASAPSNVLLPASVELGVSWRGGGLRVLKAGSLEMTYNQYQDEYRDDCTVSGLGCERCV